MSEVYYPRAIECLMPIIDGWTPVTAADLQVYQDVLYRLEQVLGTGPTNLAKSQFGPKGGNASVAARLNAFLEEDGRLHDIAFVTGTERLSAFSEAVGPGVFISFGGKTLSRSGHGPGSYIVLFSCKTPEFVGVQGQTYSLPSVEVPALWWTTTKEPHGCRIGGRQADGSIIDPTSNVTVEFALLAFGYESYVTG